MAADTKTILGLLLAAALAWLFWRYIQKRKQAQTDLPTQLFADILPLLDHAELKPGEAIGTWQITGSYLGNAFQLKAITDTLAVRKLPSLWLMVTLPGQQPIAVTIDLMMRPQGPTTFSNFDFLPHTLRTPRGFPEDAVIRSDRPDAIIPEDAMRPHLSWLQGNRGKELLLSSKGLRMVLQAAEADRARYGVFREANFGERAISATLAQKTMDTLLAISDELRKT